MNEAYMSVSLDKEDIINLCDILNSDFITLHW